MDDRVDCDAPALAERFSQMLAQVRIVLDHQDVRLASGRRGSCCARCNRAGRDRAIDQRVEIELPAFDVHPHRA